MNFLLTLDSNLVNDMIGVRVIEIKKNKKQYNTVVNHFNQQIDFINDCIQADLDNNGELDYDNTFISAHFHSHLIFSENEDNPSHIWSHDEW